MIVVISYEVENFVVQSWNFVRIQFLVFRLENEEFCHRKFLNEGTRNNNLDRDLARNLYKQIIYYYYLLNYYLFFFHKNLKARILEIPMFCQTPLNVRPGVDSAEPRNPWVPGRTTLIWPLVTYFYLYPS